MTATVVTRFSRLGGLAMLYGSRTAAVAVSLVFIPLYARLLGAHDFGWAALIVSGQTLMIMLDLGMAALTSRDLATGTDRANPLARWRQAERLLLLYFSALLALALPAAALAGWPLHLALACAVLFWALAAQNLAQVAMLARGDVKRAALIQGAGVITRALLTAAVLTWVDTSLRGFVLSQLAGALLHLAVNREIGQRGLRAAPANSVTHETLSQLARRGLPLFLVGAAGAAVLQVDKLLVGAFIGPAAVAPYFLATTFCLAPIAILGAPMAQFFQPLIIRAHASGDTDALRRRIHQLTLALIASVLLPTAALWAARELLIASWLRDAALATEVTAMTTILLPAAAIGAIGNVPLALLGALGDFGFQARLSALLTMLALAAIAWVAAHGWLIGVCWIYLAYYSVLTTALWLRSAMQVPTRLAARQSALLMLTASLPAIALAALVLQLP